MSKNKNKKTSLNVAADNASSNKTVVDSRRKNKNTSWHCGFSDIINWELRNGGCNFKDVQEYKINSRSYYIDKLIILESLPDVEKASGLVKCLRRYTFCEYKSPDDILTIRDIDRLMGLTRLHYLEDDDNSRNDVAALFVVSHFPREALKKLSDSGGLVKIEQGIYTRCTDDIPMSIVVIPELNKETYKLLTSLRRELPVEELQNLIEVSRQHSNDKLLCTCINWLLDTHSDKIIKGEIKVTNKLLKAIEQTPLGAEWLNKREAEGEAKAIIKILASRFETPSAKLQKQIMDVNDIGKLDELTDFALSCVSLGEFATAFN